MISLVQYTFQQKQLAKYSQSVSGVGRICVLAKLCFCETASRIINKYTHMIEIHSDLRSIHGWVD